MEHTQVTTLSGNLIILDIGNIGSASDTDAIAIGSDGDVTLTQDLELQHDGAILSFGANDEITLTHVHDTGLLLIDSGGTPTLQFHDSNEMSFIRWFKFKINIWWNNIYYITII